MKHYSLNPLIVVFFLLITTYCYSQQTSLLIKISNTTSYPNSTVGNSGLVTGNSLFNNYLTSINAQNLAPLFPSLHNPSANYPAYLNEAKKWYVIRVDEASKAQVANTINQNPSLYGVQFALQRNRPIPLHTPNDYNWPAFTLATPPNSGQAWDGYMAQLDAIKAKEAWDYTKGNPNVKIAIIDDGFDMDHEELSGNKVKYVNFPNATQQTHGTAVSTLAAGNTNNGKGLSAIGYNCSLLLYSTWGDAISVGGDPFECILQAVANGANVINCSFGYTFPSNPSPQILEIFAFEQNILRYAYEQNVFVVAGAGNGTQNGFHTNATDYVYPASYDYVFSVTSTFEDAINPPYFQQTPTPNFTHQVNDKVDLAAPGFRIWHATDGLNPTTNTHNYYGWGDGTSYSGPIVAGTAGLLLSINPCLTPAQITNILKSSADNISTIHTNALYTGKYGAGRLNALKAVQMTNNTDFVLTVNSGQNIALNTVNAVYGSIKIKTGGKLRIENSTLSMVPSSKIVVEPGGELNVINSTLRSKPFISSTALCPSSPSRWQGIIAEGNKNKMQNRTLQAFVFISNSTIQDATVGITTRKDSEIPSVYLQGSGAIVNCVNSTFKENGKCIEFFSYQSKNAQGNEIDNLSGATNCAFIADKGVLPGVVNNDVMVSLWDVKGVSFNGCNFKNTHQIQPTAATKGYGIFAIDASYRVRKNGNVNSTFENLEAGIKDVGNYAGADAITVGGVQFNGNKFGVILNDGGAHNIYQNTFNFNNHKMPSNDVLYGIQTNSSSNFFIESNTFIGNNPSNGNTSNLLNTTVGFNPHNSDKFARNRGNTFTIFQSNTFNSGTIGEFIDKSTTSLIVSCNAHNQGAVTFEGIITSGFASSIYALFGKCTDPKIRLDYDNKFVTPFNSLANHLRSNTLQPIDYLIKTGEPQRPQNAKTSGNFNLVSTCVDGQIKLRICNAKNLPDNGGVIVDLPHSKARYSAIKASLPDLRTNLPDFSHPTLGGRYYDLADAKHELLFAYTHSIGGEQNDEVIGEYLAFLKDDGSQEFTRMYIATLYDLDMLDLMQPALAEYEIVDEDDEAFLAYFNLLLNVKNNNRSIFELTDDEHATLTELASTDYAVAESAKGILEFVYHEHFTREIEYQASSGGNAYSVNGNLNTHTLIISPNPVASDGTFTATYNIIQNNEQSPVILDGAHISIINGFGLEVATQNLTTASGEVIFNVSGYPTGIYYVRLVDGEGHTLTHKLLCIGM